MGFKNHFRPIAAVLVQPFSVGPLVIVVMLCCVVYQVFSLAMKHGTEETFDQLCKVSCYRRLMI